MDSRPLPLLAVWLGGASGTEEEPHGPEAASSDSKSSPIPPDPAL